MITYSSMISHIQVWHSESEETSHLMSTSLLLVSSFSPFERILFPFQTFFVSSIPTSSDTRPVLDLRMCGRCGVCFSQSSPIAFQTAKLNAAIPGAESSDLVGQANDLIRRMKEHPEVEFNRNWNQNKNKFRLTSRISGSSCTSSLEAMICAIGVIIPM